MNDNLNTISITISQVDKKMLEVIDCSNKIKAILNKADDAIEKLKTSYQCAGASALYSQYELFNDGHSVIVDNILSYNLDLMSLKKKYASSVDDLSKNISAAAVRLESSATVYKEER